MAWEDFSDVVEEAPRSGAARPRPTTQQPPAASGYDAFSDVVQDTAPAAAQTAPDAIEPTGPAAAPGKNVRPERPGIMDRVADAFTGNRRTEFPDALEFGSALVQGGVRPEDLERIGAFDLTGVNTSAVTPDPNAQLDILRKSIPGLETTKDAYGNIMLRAPQFGVGEWAYLNRPGVSRRDVDELATQTLATLPALGFAGRGGNTVRAAATRGFVGIAGGELAKDALATAAGSDQGVDVPRAVVGGTLGALTAPGVPTAILEGTRNAVTAPARTELGAAVRGRLNPEREAERRVGTALERDDAAGINALSDAERRMADQTGQPVAVIDTGGETTRGLARAAANISPEARHTLDSFLGERFETQAERAGEFLTSLVGTSANATATRTALDRTRQSTLGPQYEAAYRRGAAGIHTPELEAIEQAARQAGPLQDAWREAQRAMSTKGVARTVLTSERGSTGNPTLEFWDQLTRSLNDKIGTARTGGSRELARDLTSLRNRVQADLDNAFPEYFQARGTAATFFRAGDALEAGELFATQQFGLDDAARAVGAMSQADRAMFREGFASRLIERLQGTSDRRSVVTQVVGSPAARRKLEIALGRNEAQEMEAFMRIEALLDRPRGALGNSTSVRQLVELGLVGTGAGIAGLNVNPTDPNAMMALLAAGLSFASRRTAAHVDQRVMQHIATVLTSQDPAVRQRALQAVARGNGLSTLRQLDRAATGRARSGAAQQAGQSISTPEAASQQPPREPVNAMADPAPSNQAQGRGDLPLQTRNAMAGNASPIPGGGNAMAGTDQSGTQANPIPVRTRADVERVPPGAYVVTESGEVSRRR